MTGPILIIDDDLAVLSTTRALLEYEGYAVVTAASPFGASKLIGEVRPSLVLLDINMPGLSGDGLFEVLSRNERLRTLPIIFHSSNDEDSLRKTASRLGAADYICKGDLQELSRKVRLHAR